MTIQFEGVYERDMDLLFMRMIASDVDFVREFFLKADQLSEKGYDKKAFTVEQVAHSVMTVDGESDIQAILTIEGKRIALLIEDKIDAVAMPDQASRYTIRGEKAVKRGDYEEFYVFIIAPKAYLGSNSEAKKYAHPIAYEDIQKTLRDHFDLALITHALSEANNVRLPRDAKVTAFWDELYDFVDQNYPGIFQLHGHKGLERSGTPGQWITISCPKPYGIQIKCDRAVVDLEVRGYADKFSEFSERNKVLIEEKRLYLRAATKSLAIRKYVEPVDFSQPFETQIPALRIAFDAARELQDLTLKLKTD